MQQSAKQAKGEGRSKRKESDRVFKRKKRSTYVHYSAAEVADIFRARPAECEPCRLLPSPTSFLRQMARTFHAEFPNFIAGPAFVAAVAGAAEGPAAIEGPVAGPGAIEGPAAGPGAIEGPTAGPVC